MKYLLVFSFLVFCCLTRCKKEDPVPPQPPVPTDPPIIELGKSYFLMNGTEWQGQLKARYFQEFNGKKLIRLSGNRTVYSTLVESLSIKDILPQKGIYQYNCHCDSTYIIFNGTPKILMGWIVDGDQAIGFAKVDTTKSGSFLEVIKYDSINHTIEGRFEAYLKDRTATSPNPYYPINIHLTEGKFNLKIEQ
jgi:hypothetical protein